MAAKRRKRQELDLFRDALEYGLKEIGKRDLNLKEKQYEVLEAIGLEKKDVLAILPTGYGKSLIYQVLPPVFDFLSGTNKKSIVLVISPLNALIRDQLSKMKESGLTVCALKGDHVTKGNEEEKQPLDSMRNYQLIFSHPESVVNNKNVLRILRSKEFGTKLKAIVVDEAHLALDWQDFRPAYKKLGLLSSIFTNVPILGLTATATKKARSDIVETLGLIDPIIIESNPDRSNIYFALSRRPDRGETKFAEILDPLITDLDRHRLECPLTIVFGNLETISNCFAYMSEKMGKRQYHPLGSSEMANNRVFTQYHAQYPPHEREKIVDSLLSGSSKLRIIFATIAFGVGLDLKNIRNVIHIGVPYTLEEYFQEAGRAGRDGLPSKAIIFYNSYDISRGKKNLSEEMRTYVTAKKCKRQMILSYFGFQEPQRSGPEHNCCDYHHHLCNCDECIIESVSYILDEDVVEPESHGSSLELPPDDVDRQGLLEELENFRLSQPGIGRSVVGSTSFISGVSLELINDIVEHISNFRSLEDVEDKLPVFSHDNAVQLWNIIQKYI